MDIENFINYKFNIKDLITNKTENYHEIQSYYNNAKYDAIHSFSRIKNYLNKDYKILEIGGGIHLLTNYLKEFYDITSIEPGGYSDNFSDNVDLLRNAILKIDNKNIFTTTLEEFKPKNKYDFIFSINVLEHTKNINEHISICKNLLKDKNSLLLIECPNYSFPYEPHLKEFFIPYFPEYTFTKFKKKKLIRKFGNVKYKNVIDNINFDCNFNTIKKIKLVKFLNPILTIFTRINNDNLFKKRILNNSIIKFFYYLIITLRLEKVFTKIFPKLFYPYLIIEIRKDD